jgi:hypothetical protein
MESLEAAGYEHFSGDAAFRLYTYTRTLNRSPLHHEAAQTGYTAPGPLPKEEGEGDFEKSFERGHGCHQYVTITQGSEILNGKRLSPLDRKMRCVEDAKWRNFDMIDVA